MYKSPSITVKNTNVKGHLEALPSAISVYNLDLLSLFEIVLYKYCYSGASLSF